MLPIWISFYSGYGVLVMLVAFGWIGRTILVVTLSVGMYLAARNVFKHQSLQFGGSLSQAKMDAARDYVIRVFQREVTE